MIANQNNSLSKSAAHGKSGVVFTDLEKFTEGLKLPYRTTTNPPLDFESIALQVHFTGALEIPRKFFEALQNVLWEETPTVMACHDFWKSYLADPILYIFSARKKG
ncbi:hypothetical protein BT63DRAFT_153696 [Microthyrium microscopicum]|uniref:Uncharacterized protein n=1 Tax=Microthyrium microscopicum TaxID=703497 RepID=A0A6A6UQH3_9PEZI|nr:hypothetical protein BT63DRAFT_153696 [Microthyrium microscopicum]